MAHFEKIDDSLTYLIIGEEIAPTTGNKHFHVYAVWKSKLDIKNRDKFLINGIGVNIEPIGNRAVDRYRVNAYIKKSDPNPH